MRRHISDLTVGKVAALEFVFQMCQANTAIVLQIFPTEVLQKSLLSSNFFAPLDESTRCLVYVGIYYLHRDFCKASL
jgi:hypothetical protein